MRVYFDENTSLYIAESLNILESQKKEITVFHTKREFGEGEMDAVVAVGVTAGDSGIQA